MLEDFDAEALDEAGWVDDYLPHWTTAERSRARYALTDYGLQLRIDADQLEWRPEDAPLRVSESKRPPSAVRWVRRAAPTGTARTA